MSSSNNDTVPVRIDTSPKTALTSVDLPAPFGPMMPTISPSPTSKLQPFKTSTPGRYPATRSRAPSSAPFLPFIHIGRAASMAEVRLDHVRIGDDLAG